MEYDSYFVTALGRLRNERRYRVFADLERLAGRFPHAIWHSPRGPRQVIVWCSNDYLGMAQHPKVVGAMVEPATTTRSSSSNASLPTCIASKQRWFSPPAMSRTRPAYRPSQSSCPAA